jgi:hypothetical protein
MACDLAETEFDAVVERSRKEGVGEYHIPGCRRIHNRLIDEVRRMIAPLQTDDRGGAAQYEERLENLLREAPDLADDRVSGEHLDRVADDVADELEEAVFLLTLLPAEGAGAAPFVALQELAGLLVLGAQEYLKAVENARQVHRASSREQVQDFLEAVDRTVTVEHRSDDAHRRARAGVLTFAGDCKQLHLFAGIADHLESAADALMRSALLLACIWAVLTREGRVAPYCVCVEMLARRPHQAGRRRDVRPSAVISRPSNGWNNSGRSSHCAALPQSRRR